jgi:hypothetical protein
MDTKKLDLVYQLMYEIAEESDGRCEIALPNGQDLIFANDKFQPIYTYEPGMWISSRGCEWGFDEEVTEWTQVKDSYFYDEH